MNRRCSLPFASFLALAALAPAASADGFSFSLSKKLKHGVFNVAFERGPAWYRTCASPRWIPAHYEDRTERVFVPGCERRVWVPPVYGWFRDPCGRLVHGCIRPGHFAFVRDPGHYEERTVRVWVEGAWSG